MLVIKVEIHRMIVRITNEEAALRLNVPVIYISVMSRLLPKTGERKEWDRLKGPGPHPNRPQVKQISSCQQAKHDRATISLKTAAESAPSFHIRSAMDV